VPKAKAKRSAAKSPSKKAKEEMIVASKPKETKKRGEKSPK